MVYKIILIILLVGFSFWAYVHFHPEQDVPVTVAPIPAIVEEAIPDETVILSGLKIPWDIAFIGEKEYLITERGGTLLHVKNGTTSEIKLPHPIPKGEGGLLGIALHPHFVHNNTLYLYMTTGGGMNAVFRYEWIDDRLQNEQVIIKNIPGAIYHDGGRIEFGPDEKLYIATGDATQSKIAQDLKSLGGKILRINDDGTIPEDNPFGTAVWSYGHRNPQGLTWDHEGQLWETEHGRSGVTSGYDELNLIVKGKNYGWPTIEGGATKSGMETPILHSGPEYTWAPASALYYRNKIFFGGLKGESLYEYDLDTKMLKKHFEKKFGRIRTIRKGNDGMFYILTSNRDGRGKPVQVDDRLIRINPDQFYR